MANQKQKLPHLFTQNDRFLLFSLFCVLLCCHAFLYLRVKVAHLQILQQSKSVSVIYSSIMMPQDLKAKLHTLIIS